MRNMASESETVSVKFVTEAARMDHAVNVMAYVCSDYMDRIESANEKCQALSHDLSEEKLKVDCADANLVYLIALVESQMNEMAVLEEQRSALIHAFNMRKARTEANRKGYEVNMQKYSDLWESYLKIYKQFPLVKKLHELQSKDDLLRIRIKQARHATALANRKLQVKKQIHDQQLAALGRKRDALNIQVGNLKAELEDIQIAKLETQAEIERISSLKADGQLQEKQLYPLDLPANAARIGTNTSTISTPVRQAFERFYMSSSQPHHTSLSEPQSQAQLLSQFHGSTSLSQDNVRVSFNRRERIIEESCSVVLPASHCAAPISSNVYVEPPVRNGEEQAHKRMRLTEYGSTDTDDMFSGSSQDELDVWNEDPPVSSSADVRHNPPSSAPVVFTALNPPNRASVRTDNSSPSAVRSPPQIHDISPEARGLGASETPHSARHLAASPGSAAPALQSPAHASPERTVPMAPPPPRFSPLSVRPNVSPAWSRPVPTVPTVSVLQTRTSFSSVFGISKSQPAFTPTAPVARARTPRGAPMAHSQPLPQASPSTTTPAAQEPPRASAPLSSARETLDSQARGLTPLPPVRSSPIPARSPQPSMHSVAAPNASSLSQPTNRASAFEVVPNVSQQFSSSQPESRGTRDTSHVSSPLPSDARPSRASSVHGEAHLVQAEVAGQSCDNVAPQSQRRETDNKENPKGSQLDNDGKSHYFQAVTSNAEDHGIGVREKESAEAENQGTDDPCAYVPDATTIDGGEEFANAPRYGVAAFAGSGDNSSSSVPPFPVEDMVCSPPPLLSLSPPITDGGAGFNLTGEFGCPTGSGFFALGGPSSNVNKVQTSNAPQRNNEVFQFAFNPSASSRNIFSLFKQ